MTTLRDAQIAWRHMRENDGGYCPCCDRWGKDYRRGINHTMAASIVWLSYMTEPGGDFIDVPKRAPRYVLASNQLSTMQWWGLCERRAVEEGDDRKHSGMWRVTELGARWAANRTTVPKYVWTYNKTVLRTEGPEVRVNECVENFSYDEVMSTRYVPRGPDGPQP